MTALALGMVCVAAGIAWRVFLILRHGAEASPVHKWRELGHAGADRLSWQEQGLAKLKSLASRLNWLGGFLNQRLPVKTTSIIDPVDGTSFAPGETIIRCSCGTAYHAHSWQWLGENNGSRCVSCKKSGMVAMVNKRKMAS